MKKILLFWLIIVCVIFSAVYFYYMSLQEEEKEYTGSLQINAVSGFNVFVDEELKGKTEAGGFELSELAVGEHQVRVEKEDLAPQVYDVIIEPNKKIEINPTSFVSKREREKISIENLEEILIDLPISEEISISPDKQPKNVNIINTVDIKMVRIPAGTVIMEEKNKENDEVVTQEITISKGFMIGKYEVTQKQYKDIMSDNPSRFEGESNPVEQVSWQDAFEFCKRLTDRERELGKISNSFEYSLPTEAQWEYVACCGKNNDSKYSGSCELDPVGWYKNNSSSKTHAVGSKLPNAWGIYDMSGNVWEWCLDWYGAYPDEDVNDYSGPDSGEKRVVRGGSWYNSSWYCSSDYRFWFNPSLNHFSLGFRVCLNVCE